MTRDTRLWVIRRNDLPVQSQDLLSASGERILGLGGKFLWLLLDQLFPDHTPVIPAPDKQREDIELISAPPTQIYITTINNMWLSSLNKMSTVSKPPLIILTFTSSLDCITVMGNYQFHLPEAISNYGRIRVFIFRGDLFTEWGGSRLDKALLSVHKDHLHITEYCPKLQWKQGGRSRPVIMSA